MRIQRFPRLRKQEDVSERILSKVLDNMNKVYRKRRSDVYLASLEDSVFALPKAYISSGILPIDCVVGYGKGFPGAGIVEIFGPEASGKTAFLEHTIAKSQEMGFYCGLFPQEYSPSIKRMESVGINPKSLFIGDAETIEDIFEQIMMYVKGIRKYDKTTPIVIGIDTIAATPTRSEMDNKKGLDASDMGKAALQISKFFRRMVQFLYKNTVCLLCLNQTRTSLGVKFGNPETTYGGKALRFYAWIRCRVRVKGLLKDKEGEEIGQICLIKCVKNKFAPPFKECSIPLYWKSGIDHVGAIWEYCTAREIFPRKGTTYRYEGKMITRKSFKKIYARDRKGIEKLVLSSLNGGV